MGSSLWLIQSERTHHKTAIRAASGRVMLAVSISVSPCGIYRLSGLCLMFLTHLLPVSVFLWSQMYLYRLLEKLFHRLHRWILSARCQVSFFPQSQEGEAPTLSHAFTSAVPAAIIWVPSINVAVNKKWPGDGKFILSTLGLHPLEAET